MFIKSIVLNAWPMFHWKSATSARGSLVIRWPAARRRLRREDYTVGWLCALPIELAAAEETVDEFHDALSNLSDNEIYTLGRIGEHNVVIACPPQMGTNQAADVAARMDTTFPSIRIRLMVGIGGGVPSTKADIQLGDVVVSKPENQHGGVVQYDSGKSTSSGFQRTGFLNAPPKLLQNAVAQIRAKHLRGSIQFLVYAARIARLASFSQANAGPDHLFDQQYTHAGGDTCEDCDARRMVQRPSRRDNEVVVHYGTIVSGNQVMKSAVERDRVSHDLGGAFCFEMEAAGLMNTFPSIVIRGICDYSDSHKNKGWQGYDVLGHFPYAVDAPFNSWKRQHEAVCHRATRVNVITKIKEWSTQNNQQSLFWLNGVAGTGKTTIARTVARGNADEGTLGASFFFSRGGGDVGTARKFATSIARQLAHQVPALVEHICDAVQKHGDIADRSIEDQWDSLIVQPLRKLQGPTYPPFLVIVIDTLDECDNDDDIVLVLRLVAAQQPDSSIRLRFFLTSRPDIPIRRVFSKLPASGHDRFVLHEMVDETRSDLTIFLEAELTTIAVNHGLGKEWPGQTIINQLVDRANGLFIWAATTCRFIDNGGMPFANDRLRTILEKDGPVSSPQASLDRIYTTILCSCIPDSYSYYETSTAYGDLRYVLETIVVLFAQLSPASIGLLLGIARRDVEGAFDGLHSIVIIPDDPDHPLRIHYPSLRDYLLDHSRCIHSEIFIDERESLSKDICGLGFPGMLLEDLPDDKVTRCIPLETQYACTYWVRHLLKSAYTAHDNDFIHQFLKQHLLHWLEALCLLKEVQEAIVSLNALLSHVGDCQSLREFIKDAKRFVQHSQSCLQQAPLQMYFSALVFAPTKSVVRNQFKAEAY
ncbi:hypothetical protein BJY04DRAFT_215056 [Aspergillus karnatakaensis]|uniref:uncharacterized protein n=1 Tax=Aspergillus karnatakaensis TaxID=1810916 RepID=UPI003CCD5F39